MSNTFKFADKLGFESKLKNPTIKSRSGHYFGLINFDNLFKFLIKGRNNDNITNSFDYLDFKSTSRVSTTKSDINELNRLNTKDFITYKDKSFLVSVPYEGGTSDGEKISLFPKAVLNKKIESVWAIPDYAIYASFEKESVIYLIAFAYLSDSDKGFGGNKDNIRLKNRALYFECKYYNQFDAILTALNIPIESDIEENLVNTFNNAFNKATDDANNLDWLYGQAPNFIIKQRGQITLIKDLTTILEGLVDEIGVNEERVVMRIVESLYSIYFDINQENEGYLRLSGDILLKQLLEVKVNKKTLFERLYTKMNDSGFGEENFTKLMKFLYNVWRFSSWANPLDYNEIKNSGPVNIAYTNKKILGFYKNGMDFIFKESKEGLRINVTETKKVGGSIRSGSGDIITINIGEYHPYQAIRMPQIPERGEFAIDNTLIPAFYLKAFDDKAAWKNFDTGAWLLLDIISTFSGVGNVLKFRHLLKIGAVIKGSKTLVIIKIGASLIEMTSGALGAFLTFTDNCNFDPSKSKPESENNLCQVINEYLFLLELASLSGEALVESLLKKKVREAKSLLEESLSNTKNLDEFEMLREMDDHIDYVIKLADLFSRKISNIDELIVFLAKMDNRTRARDLEKVGINALFRGTVRLDGIINKGTANSVKHGYSTSTDPIRAILFATYTQSFKNNSKGIIQIFIPSNLIDIKLAGANTNYFKELEVILDVDVKQLEILQLKEVSLEKAREIANRFYKLPEDLPTTLKTEGELNRLLRELPKSTVQKSNEFLNKLIKL